MATATHQQPPPQRPYHTSHLLFSSHPLQGIPSTSAPAPHKQLATGTLSHITPSNPFASASSPAADSITSTMSAPIPISPSSPSRDAYPSPSSASASSGMSPHTPFTPLPPSITPTSVGTANGTNAGSGLLRWASLSFGKSPNSPSTGAHFGTGTMGNNAVRPAQDQPQVHVQGHDHDHDEHHDVFEFGDFNHMAKGSWTGHGRRAASMSMASGVNAAGGGGGGMGNEQSLSAMLSGGFGGPPSPMQEVGQGQGMNIPRSVPAGPAGSPPGAGFRGGVVADNAAKGAGVLRRLSLSGSLTRPSFLSPPGQKAALPPQPSITTSISTGPPAQAQGQGNTIGQPQTSALTNAKPVADDGGGLRVPLGQRGRRYSENSARKRGVSPMGERILRDHGGF